MTLGPDGLHLEDPGSITTATGKRVNPLALHPDDIDIKDIARALSRQCRYNGHVGGFLSVARHSLIVAEHLPAELKLAGLLHDAAETYLGDLVRPLKHSTFGKEYMLAEGRAEAVIAQAFGLQFPIPDEVMAADHQVLIDVELPETVGLRWSGASTPERDEQDFLAAYLRYRDLMPAPQPGRIIGLTGRMQSGKDTVGGFLTEHGFQRLAFADKLREGLLALNPLVPVRFDSVTSLSTLVESVGWDEAKQNPEVRRLLQQYGTEAGRAIHGEECWIDALRAEVKPHVDYVITDVRFPNEAQAIKEWGGQVWRVRRPAADIVGITHVSETALDGWCYDRIIANGGTLDDLQFQVQDALSEVDWEAE